MQAGAARSGFGTAMSAGRPPLPVSGSSSPPPAGGSQCSPTRLFFSSLHSLTWVPARNLAAAAARRPGSQPLSGPHVAHSFLPERTGLLSTAGADPGAAVLHTTFCHLLPVHRLSCRSGALHRRLGEHRQRVSGRGPAFSSLRSEIKATHPFAAARLLVWDSHCWEYHQTGLESHRACG